MMAENKIQSKHQKNHRGIKVAIAQAIERHHQLGESIALCKDGKVVVLTADQIPLIQIQGELSGVSS